MNRSLLVRMFLAAQICGIGWLSIPSPGLASNSSKLAIALARLRSEVETLSSQLEEKRENFRLKKRSLAMQTSSADLSLQKEKMHLVQLQKRWRKRQEKVATSNQSAESLRPIAQQAYLRLHKRIENGLPFKQKERLGALKKIHDQLNAKLITPRKAISRFWQFVEDEIRLSRESGLYTQMIQFQNQQMLVETIRVGMVMLFFKTRDGKLGKAVYKDRKWIFQQEHNAENVTHLRSLFDGFKKKIRTGFWTLPNALRGKAQ